MDSEALKFLQQLSANPQLVNQLQNILTNVSSSSHADSRIPSLDATLSTPHSQQVDASNYSSQLSKARGTMEFKSIPSLPRTSTSPVSTLQHQLQSPVAQRHCFAQGYSSRQRSQFIDETSSGNASAGGLDNYDPQGTVSRQRYEQLLSRCHLLERQLAIKSTQVSESSSGGNLLKRAEDEISQLRDTVQSLQSTVEQQQRKIKEKEVAHRLEIDDLKSSHVRDIGRIVEAHDLALQKLINSQQLVDAARVYEKLTSEGVEGRLSNLDDPLKTSSRYSLSHASTPARRTLPPTTGSAVSLFSATPKGSDIKLEGDGLQSVYRAKFAEGTSVSVKRERDDDLVTPAAKIVKKRTPRTPSYTAAERVAAASKSMSKPSVPADPVTKNRDGQNALNTCFHGFSNSVVLSSKGSRTPCSRTLADAVALHQRQLYSDGAVKHAAVVPTVLRRGWNSKPLVSPTSLTISKTPPQRELVRQVGGRSETSSAVGGSTCSPSPVNPNRQEARTRYFILTSLDDREYQKVSEAIRNLGQGASLIELKDNNEVPPLTTHVVVRGEPHSMKALLGLVSSRWLVPPEYVFASSEAGFWLNEEDEGGKRYFPPPLRTHRFLLTMHDGILRDRFKRLVEFGGGEVVSSEKGKHVQDQGAFVISSVFDLLQFVELVGGAP
uniref:WGS project CAEQ00000000 data, annotated contig 1777 n=1 Tax=Trypanosoma congolense (strain IL3000) TaxID=1068625 RepID=F9W8T9_TRYCI|nr:unnamed protein product [Trypanosoma congolense IL3000]